jgi:nucleoside-diphosphate-sugar epimerase
MSIRDVVLVTGADGLLGRRVTEYLHKCSKVYALVHSEPKMPVPEVDYIVNDFSVDLNRQLLPHKVDSIIHLAQSSNFRDFPNSALDVFQVNVASTAQMLDYARSISVKNFIYTSSGGVYGNGSEAFKENAPIVPPGQLGYYLGSKACGEILVQSYASIFKVVILRPFFMYGPGQNRSMLIPRLMESVATGRPITLQGDDGLRINPVHVDDAAKSLIAGIEINESSTFNIAGPDVLSIREICEAMGKYLGRSPEFVNQPGHASDLIADISAMTEKLFTPRIKLFDSFAQLL